MANVNRQGPMPFRRRDESASSFPNASRRGPVPIRRNVEDFDDPYLPSESYRGTVICRECHAVNQNERWSLDERIYQEAVKAADAHYIVCPACQKLHDRQPGGIVTLSSDFIPEHRDEILNLIRNEDVRARHVNPLERVMEIQEDGSQMVVTTTNEKLAQRLGRAVGRAYGGHVHYHWTSDSKQARVWWTR
ncbi:MAG: ATPase [Armatimonadetes bacterium]|nr:ATPase [Armatimonadota bacterium]